MLLPKVNTINFRRTQTAVQSTYTNMSSTTTIIYFTELNFSGVLLMVWKAYSSLLHAQAI